MRVWQKNSAINTWIYHKSSIQVSSSMVVDPWELRTTCTVRDISASIDWLGCFFSVSTLDTNLTEKPQKGRWFDPRSEYFCGQIDRSNRSVANRSNRSVKSISQIDQCQIGQISITVEFKGTAIYVCRSNRSLISVTSKKKKMEKRGMDPRASCMLSMRSTIWATSPIMVAKNVLDTYSRVSASLFDGFEPLDSFLHPNPRRKPFHMIR